MYVHCRSIEKFMSKHARKKQFGNVTKWCVLEIFDEECIIMKLVIKPWRTAALDVALSNYISITEIWNGRHPLPTTCCITVVQL